jgi:integrase
VSEAVAELIADRKDAGCSTVHLRDMEARLGRFGRHFQMQLSTVSAALVRDYLRGLTTAAGQPVTNRTKRNVLRLVCSLIHFGRKRGFIQRELADEIAEIDAPKSELTKTGIFSPKDIGALLTSAAPELVAPMAIGAFAGLRTAELARLDWSQIKLTERVIIVEAAQSKTASRRVVPIAENLAAWLAAQVRAEGPVSPCTRDAVLSNRFSRVADRLGMVWVKNGLRHSFCSYRLAVTPDPARVATEAGNSANMVHRHYKALVTEADGKAWFDIMPPAGGAKVLPMPRASVAA